MRNKAHAERGGPSASRALGVPQGAAAASNSFLACLLPLLLPPHVMPCNTTATVPALLSPTTYTPPQLPKHRFGLPQPEAEREKLKERAKRFGLPDEELAKEKMEARAARFGTKSVVTGLPDGQTADKLKARAERFGASAAAAK